MVDAEEALRIGLADRVAPAAEVYATAEALVRPYVTGPSLALRAAKQAIDGGLSMDLASGWPGVAAFRRAVRHRRPGRGHDRVRGEA
jgi:enoyl-CoA hydratase/carnithine racemase